MFSLQMTSLKCLYSHFLKKHLAPNPIRAVEAQWRKQISALSRLCRGIPAFLPLTPWCGWRLHGQPRLLPSSSSNKTILILLMDWCMGRPTGESSQSLLPVVLKSPPPHHGVSGDHIGSWNSTLSTRSCSKAVPT